MNRPTFSPASLFIILLFLSLFGLFFYFGLATIIHTPSPMFKMISAIADSALITAALSMLRGRWRYVAVTIPPIVALLLWCNLTYYRHFNDLIPGSAYFHSQIFDRTVVTSVRESLHFADIIMLFPALTPLIFAVCVPSRKFTTSIPGRGIKRGVWITAAVAWVMTLGGAMRRYAIYEDSSNLKLISEKVFCRDWDSWRSFYNTHNFIGYITRCFYYSFNSYRALTPEEKDEITAHLYSKSQQRQLPPVTGDSGVSPNLIIIVVESLPSKALEDDAFRHYSPTLQKLMRDSSVITANCTVLVGQGHSSDAQFIINTGLLPLRNEIMVSNYATNDYPSLAKALGYNSLEIICEDKSLYSHGETSKSYGFDKLIDNVAINGLNQDSILLSRVLHETKAMKQPLFIFSTTMSMHGPYSSPNTTDTIPDGGPYLSDRRDAEYMRRLYHFDTALAKFLKQLKDDDLYANTIIAICGDHHIMPLYVSEALVDNRVPFIIINSHINQPYTREASQTDIFPTLLDVMQIRYNYHDIDYSGMGHSLFADSLSVDDRSTSDQDYKISELMIRSKK